MNISEGKLLRFGEFTFDPCEGLLKNGENSERLSARTCDVLLALVSRPGELVSKDDLLALVWKGSFVEEGILTVHVSRLRKLLGDDAHSPRYVETVPKKGYKFMLHPEVVDRSNRDSSRGLSMGSPSSVLNREYAGERLPTRYKIVIGLALLAAAATGILAVAISYTRFAESETVTITKLTGSDGVSIPAISPDGSWVAYPVTSAGKASLVVREIRTMSEVTIVPPADVAYDGVTFAPDGKSIYYTITDATGKAQVYRVATFGGASTPVSLAAIDVLGVDVSPDGQRLAFTASNISTGESLIKVSDTNGSNESVLIALQNPSYFDPAGTHNLDWSPDGKLIAAAYRTGSNAFSRLITVDTSDGTLNEFSGHSFGFVTGVSWLPDMSGLMISARGENAINGQLWFVEYPAGKARQITKDGNDYAHLVLADDGRSMVALQNEAQSQLWVADAAGDIIGAPFDKVSLKADSAKAIGDAKVEGWRGVAWTPDGRVVFASKVSGNWDIWVMNSDGSDRRQLTTYEGNDIGPTVSRDGKVVFISTRSGVAQLWKMDLYGTNQTQLTFGPTSAYGSISSDGLWAVFASPTVGASTVWKMPIGGGEAIQLTGKPSFRPWISPDGKLIAYDCFLDEQSRIAVIPADGGPPIYDLDLIRTPSYEPLVKWLPGSNGLTIVNTEGGVGNIWAMSLDGKQRRQLTDFKSNVIWDYSWSHDGTKLLLARGRRVRDVVLMKLATN